MKRVKGVEDLNICSISARGIVGVGVWQRVWISYATHRIFLERHS